MHYSVQHLKGVQRQAHGVSVCVCFLDSVQHAWEVLTVLVLVCIRVQGEGRAIALSKSLQLGEALPPLRFVFQDSHGNVVPVSGEWQQPAVTLQVLEAGPGNGGAVLRELQAEADMDAHSDGINVQHLRLLGSAAASGAGMQLFKPAQLPAAASAVETAGAQRSLRGAARCAGAAAGSAVPIVRAVDVYLAVHVDGMPQQVLGECQ